MTSVASDIKPHNCNKKKVSVVPCRAALDRELGDSGADTPVRELHARPCLLREKMVTRLQEQFINL